MAARAAHYRWYILGLLATANLLHYANRNVVFHKTVYDDLRTAFEVSQADLGLLLTAFMIPHALATLPLSWLADRYDRRYVIALGMVLWSAAELMAMWATGLTTLLVSRAVLGLGTAACVPMANAILCTEFDGPAKARTVSIFNLGLFLGGVVGIGIGGALGFPGGLIAVAVPGFVLALLVARLDLRPDARGGFRADAGQGGDGLWSAMASSLSQFGRDAKIALAVTTFRRMLIGAVLMAFAAGAYIAWFIEFLVDEKKLGSSEATVLFGVILAGGLIGVVTGGIVADKLQRRSKAGRQLAVAIGFGLSVPCALAALYLPKGIPFYAASLLLMFFISWYHGPIAAAVDDLVPRERAATAQGTYIASMHLLGTAPSSFAVGLLADEVGLTEALLLPTAAMAVAAVLFVLAGRSAPADTVIHTVADVAADDPNQHAPGAA